MDLCLFGAGTPVFFCGVKGKPRGKPTIWGGGVGSPKEYSQADTCPFGIDRTDLRPPVSQHRSSGLAYPFGQLPDRCKRKAEGPRNETHEMGANLVEGAPSPILEPYNGPRACCIFCKAKRALPP